MAQEKPLPGVSPCRPDDWLRVDVAYAAQMSYREALLAEKGEEVLWSDAAARPAVAELRDVILTLLPGLGFQVSADSVIRPDGRRIVITPQDPLRDLGHLIQQDLCILQKQGDEHVLTAAVICFPANWRLAEKVMRPLSDIHLPVDAYDADVALRVQRLFDGVQVGRPLWRFNRLPYGNADLHQPQRGDQSLPKRFIRSERQTILRLPVTQAVVFAIHTFVVHAE